MNSILAVYEKAMPDALGWQEKIASAAQAGFDALEISIDESDWRLTRLDWDRASRNQLVSLTRDTGIYINTMCLSGHRKYPMGSADADIRRRSMEIMEKAIELSYDLGIRIIQLAGYDVYYEPSTEDSRSYFAENLEKGVRMAATRGIQLGFETMETDFMNTTEKAMKYVQMVDSPYLGVYPDIGNLTNGARNVVADLQTGEGHICAAHLKETVAGVFRNRMFGDGRVDFAADIAELKRQGVGMYTAEFWYLGEPDYRINLRKAHDYLRPYLR